MENLFNGIAPISGEVVVTSVKESAALNLCGAITLTKGNFSEEFYYNATLCESSKYKGFVIIDDIDFDNNNNTSLGVLKIDNIHKFRQSLQESGLTSLAKTLEFSREEIDNACNQVIAKSKLMKKTFKGLVLFDALSKEEQSLVELGYVIANYKTLKDYDKKQVLLVYDEEGNQLVPTEEQLIELYQSKKQSLA
jgi:hypothetical protein